MQDLIKEFKEILLGLLGLVMIFVIFIGIFRLAGMFSHQAAYAVGLVYWVFIAIAFANAWAHK